MLDLAQSTCLAHAPGAPDHIALGHANRRLLQDIGAWAKSEAEAAEIFCHLHGARLKQARVKINRDLVRVVMLVLSLGALNDAAAEPETFSLRKLARILDRPREESMQRSLRNWVMPLLRDAGWISGFVETQEWSSTPHEIQITGKGLAAVAAYLRKLGVTNSEASSCA
jgi:hypothetical protein